MISSPVQIGSISDFSRAESRRSRRRRAYSSQITLPLSFQSNNYSSAHESMSVKWSIFHPVGSHAFGACRRRNKIFSPPHLQSSWEYFSLAISFKRSSLSNDLLSL